MAGTRYPMDNVSRVFEGGTQVRSVEKKFNWSERARVLRPAPGTPTPSRTASFDLTHGMSGPGMASTKTRVPARVVTGAAYRALARA
jgi:hypothetical protein